MQTERIISNQRNSTIMRIANKKEQDKTTLKKKFNEKDSIWRIEAVIHDGNWYDKDKWRRVAKVTIEELEQWILENEDILITSNQESYRVNYDEIIKWYNEQKLPLEKSIVPNNFPPKIWGKLTETDTFLLAPRRRVGTVSFYAVDQELLRKCMIILRGAGKIMPDVEGRHRAFGLSAVHMRSLLSKGLTPEEYESLDVKTRAMLHQRELIDLPEVWLESALRFYTNIFAPGILRSSMSTISIYIPEKADIQSQIMIWVIYAMKKFNENASVPFSGYLSTVLRHWPYDLPDEYLGKELSRFQRERKKAIDIALMDDKKKYDNRNVPIDVLAEIMDITVEEYVSLNNEHENWLSERNATTLTWEDSSNEKKGDLIGKEHAVKIDAKKMAKFSMAAVKAAVDSEDWQSTYIMIEQIDTNNPDDELHEKLSKSFTDKLAEHLIELTKQMTDTEED